MVGPRKWDDPGGLKEDIRSWLTASDVKKGIQDLWREISELRDKITELRATLDPDAGMIAADMLEGTADDLERQYGKGTIFLRSGRESNWEALREQAQRWREAAKEGRRRWESIPCPQCGSGRMVWQTSDAPALTIVAKCDVCGVSVTWSDITFEIADIDETP